MNKRIKDIMTFKSLEDAREVVKDLLKLLEDYGKVTVADLYDLVGETSNYRDNLRGWTSLGDVITVGFNRHGYTINIPDPILLDVQNQQRKDIAVDMDILSYCKKYNAEIATKFDSSNGEYILTFYYDTDYRQRFRIPFDEVLADREVILSYWLTNAEADYTAYIQRLKKPSNI